MAEQLHIYFNIRFDVTCGWFALAYCHSWAFPLFSCNTIPKWHVSKILCDTPDTLNSEYHELAHRTQCVWAALVWGRRIVFFFLLRSWQTSIDAVIFTSLDRHIVPVPQLVLVHHKLTNRNNRAFARTTSGKSELKNEIWNYLVMMRKIVTNINYVCVWLAFSMWLWRSRMRMQFNFIK